jgi:hypothetical protein
VKAALLNWTYFVYPGIIIFFEVFFGLAAAFTD